MSSPSAGYLQGPSSPVAPVTIGGVNGQVTETITGAPNLLSDILHLNRGDTGAQVAAFQFDGTLSIPGLLLSGQLGVNGASPALYGSALAVTPQNASTVGARVRGAASQSASLLLLEDSASTTVLACSVAGLLQVKSQIAVNTNFLNPINNSVLSVGTGATGNQGITVRGVASQSANLQEWQNSTPNTVTSISPAGVLSTNNLALTSATTATTATAGTNAQPALVAGFLVLSVNGTNQKVPYYAV